MDNSRTEQLVMATSQLRGTETMDNVSVKLPINLIDNMKLITKPAYWCLSLPDWSEFSARLPIRTLVGSAFHLIVNIFICSVTLFETVRSFQNGKTFGQNVFKVKFMSYQCVGVVSHVYYLWQHCKVQRFLQSFQKLENDVAAMETCQRDDSPDHFKSIKPIALISWKGLFILASFINTTTFFNSGSQGSWLGVFLLGFIIRSNIA